MLPAGTGGQKLTPVKTPTHNIRMVGPGRGHSCGRPGGAAAQVLGTGSCPGPSGGRAPHARVSVLQRRGKIAGRNGGGARRVRQQRVQSRSGRGRVVSRRVGRRRTHSHARGWTGARDAHARASVPSSRQERRRAGGGEGRVRADDATKGAQPSAVAGTAAKKPRRARSHAARSDPNKFCVSACADASASPAEPGEGEPGRPPAGARGVASRRFHPGMARQTASCATKGKRPVRGRAVGKGRRTTHTPPSRDQRPSPRARPQ